MQNNIAGPGQLLPVPARLYPAILTNGAPFGENTTTLSLPPGDSLAVPAGTWDVSPGPYTGIQYYDPITLSWRWGCGGPLGFGIGSRQIVHSDGFNVRVSNLSGCVIGAIVTDTDEGWAESTTTITPSAGNSTWQPIVGGALNTTASIVSAGSGYGMPPILIAPAPPAPGIPASYVATISGGTVNAVTCIDQGAGYGAGTYTLTVIPNPQDPNFLAGSSITAATVTAAATSGTSTSGSVTGAICTNPGAALSALPTLTITGAGTGVTLAPLWLVSASSISISGGGAGYSSQVGLTTVGGGPSAVDAFSNPTFDGRFIPRPMSAVTTATTGVITTGAPTGIYDRGVFLVTAAADYPTLFVESLALATTVAAGAITLGGVNDSVVLQQL